VIRLIAGGMLRLITRVYGPHANGAVQLSTQRADSCAKLRSIAHLGRNPGAHEDHVRAQGL